MSFAKIKIKSLVVISFLLGGVCFALSSSITFRDFGIGGNSFSFNGFPFHWYESAFLDLLGSVQNYFILNAIADFIFWSILTFVGFICYKIIRAEFSSSEDFGPRFRHFAASPEAEA